MKLYYEFKNVNIAIYDKETNIFYYNYDTIFSVLNQKYSLNNFEIDNLIKDMGEKYLKIKGVTPKIKL